MWYINSSEFVSQEELGQRYPTFTKLTQKQTDPLPEFFNLFDNPEKNYLQEFCVFYSLKILPD